MEKDELLRRCEDLANRCSRNCEMTNSLFLTPGEQMAVSKWAKFSTDCPMVIWGGREECERKAAFFLPYYMDETMFAPEDTISVLQIKAGFGEPGHRDYMGSVLGLGIKREWVGDIWVQGDRAYIFCMKSVESLLLTSLEKVGRYGVKVSKVASETVPAPKRETKQVTFTVKSMRFDAVCAGMFDLSRTECSKLIEAGLAALNYEECTRLDTAVNPGDIISLRGHGKGIIGEKGGVSRKGRTFVDAEILK